MKKLFELFFLLGINLIMLLYIVLLLPESREISTDVKNDEDKHPKHVTPRDNGSFEKEVKETSPRTSVVLAHQDNTG